MKKLSNKKTKWVNQFKPKVLKGTPLPNDVSLEIKVANSLKKLTDSLIKETEKELSQLFKTNNSKKFFATDESISSQARIILNALSKKYASIFLDKGKLISDYMVNQANNSSKSQVHNSLKDLSGLSIKTSNTSQRTMEIMKASVSQSVSYISSIQERYLTDVEGAVFRSITSGEGIKDLIPAMQKFGNMSHNKARNLALDQTRKTTNAIKTQKLKDAGVKKFIWNHSAGGLNPRQRHIDLDGKIFSYDDLPIIDDSGTRGLPAQAPNCRCFQTPVIEFEEE